MKPAGLDEGPVVSRAEHAIETGDAKEAIGFVLHSIEEDLKRRFNDVLAKKRYEVNDVNAGRAFIQAYINFVVYSHHLYASVTGGGGHGHGGEERKGHHH